jgi:hypothetical protein
VFNEANKNLISCKAMKEEFQALKKIPLGTWSNYQMKKKIIGYK